MGASNSDYHSDTVAGIEHHPNFVTFIQTTVVQDFLNKSLRQCQMSAHFIVVEKYEVREEIYYQALAIGWPLSLPGAIFTSPSPQCISVPLIDHRGNILCLLF